MRRLGLRARVTATLAVGALVLSTTMAALSYQFIRNSLLVERERTALRAAYYDAAAVRSRLKSASDPGEALAQLGTTRGRRPVVVRNGTPYLLSTDTRVEQDIPDALRQLVEDRQAGLQRVRTGSGPAIVVGIPLPENTQYYEIVALDELETTLDSIALILALVAAGVTLAGAGLGRYTSRRALRPLTTVAQAARGIAAGNLDARLDSHAEPDLANFTNSFNHMVDQLQIRIERDRRFAADVSHELRSPLQTLANAAALLSRRSERLDERSAAAAQLVVEEVGRFEHLVTDLLEITRADSNIALTDVDVLALARAQCVSRGIDPAIVRPSNGIDTVWLADSRRVEQILVNLLENAQRHGGGAIAIRLRQTRTRNVIEVDDDGPGVMTEDREDIFRPFVRGATAERRGDTGGAGLGLAIVSRLAESHGGRALVRDRPGGGARFRVELARRPA
jgi:signal transduction histidine kinase